MGSTWRKTLACAFAVGGGLAVGTSSASAQGYGTPGSLGGYGATSSFASSGMGGNSPMIIPYSGMFEGFMPGRMGGGSELAFRSRPTMTMGSNRTSFSLSPLSGGMSSMSGGTARGIGTGTRPMATFGSPGGMRLSGGTGLGGGMGRMSGAGRSSVMPPSIGYPFRQPPSLLSPSTSIGMSM